MKKILLLLILLVALIRPAGAEVASSPTLRIISCAPNLTGMLFLLDLEDSIVGVSTHTNWPEEAADIPQVADLFNPNLEAMMRLQPTHVLGLESTVKINEFFGRRAGVEVLTFGRIESLKEIDGAFLRLADAFDRRSMAEEYLANRPISKRDATDGEPVRVLFVLGYGSGLSQLNVIGHGTYVGELIERAGGVNVVP
ncbi:MAG: ABC transporter substrate-binding protein, partial [Candidatus Sumerlaeia bacterium]|nr:ABC transporter substrate-binding protein [Candidatus Sumerlaeia bacterium]